MAWANLIGSRIISPEEMEGALRLPVLAIIPHIERRKGTSSENGPKVRRIDLEGRWRSRLLIHFPKDAPAYGPYLSVVRDLAALARDKRRNVWIVAGSVAGEGTSLTCMNLSIVARLQGIRTLIIEGHTRAPRISSVFRLALEPGLSGCLNRALNAESAIQKSPLAEVDVLPAGRSVAYPETLWGSPAFHRLLGDVRSHYDLVFFEAPPILLYPDVAVLADKTDGILLVHQFGRTSPHRVEKVMEKLGASREQLLGVLLNDVPVGLPVP